MKSIWEENSCRKTFGRLEGDIKISVLIVGGGIAGLLTAYMLKKAGWSVRLLRLTEFVEVRPATLRQKSPFSTGWFTIKLSVNSAPRQRGCTLKHSRLHLRFLRKCAKKYPVTSAVKKHPTPTVGGERYRNPYKFPDPYRTALSPFRLCSQIQQGGTFLGLALPRLAVYRRWKTDRKPRNRW